MNFSESLEAAPPFPLFYTCLMPVAPMLVLITHTNMVQNIVDSNG